MNSLFTWMTIASPPQSPTDTSALQALLRLEVVERFGWALVHSSWLFGIVGLLLWCSRSLLVRSSPQARCRLSYLTLFSMPPMIITLACLIDVPNPATGSTTSVNTTAATQSASTAVGLVKPNRPVLATDPERHDLAELQKSQGRATSPTQIFDSNSIVTRRWLETIVIGWLAGVLLLSIRPTISFISLRRLRQRETSAVSPATILYLTETAQRLGVRRAIRILQSSLVEVPTVIGFFKPLILLPASALTGLSSEQLHALIAHEIAHVRRNDYLLNALQTVVETLLFYHPIVWWVSFTIREERENCCDDTALKLCGSRTVYAGALLAMERLRTSPSLAMSARGGSLLRRVQRLAGLTPPTRSAGNLWVPALCAAVAVSAICLGSLLSSPSLATADETVKVADLWGKPVGGLRVRVAPVLTSMNEDKVDLNLVQRTFASRSQLAFAVEIENVSGAAIKFLDTRYGEGYGTSRGKANSDWSSQFLFAIDYYDGQGQKIPRPTVEVVDLNMPLAGALATDIAAGEKHRFLIRPSKWRRVMDQRLASGTYTAVVHYHGLPKRTADRIKQYRPTSEVLGAWSGDAASAATEFTLSKKTPDSPRANPSAWGTPVNGLRAALELSPNTPAHQHGEKPDVLLHVQNVSGKPITLASQMWMSPLRITAKNDAGQSVDVQHIDYSGWTLTSRVTLQPKQTAIYDAGNLGIAQTQEQADKFQHITHRKLIAPAGKYTLRARNGFTSNAILSTGQGKQLAPIEGDYTGVFETGPMPLVVETLRVPSSGDAGSRPEPAPKPNNKPNHKTPDNKPPAAGKQASRITSDQPMSTGIVVDPDGQPVPGVEVIVYQGSLPPQHRLITDKRGQFQIPKQWRRSKLFLTLVARRGNTHLGWFHFAMQQNSNGGQKDDVEPFKLTLLPRSRAVRGRAVDTAGRPISNALVLIEQLNHGVNLTGTHWQDRMLDDARLVNGGRTDAQGQFTVMFPAGATGILRIRHREWASQRIFLPKSVKNPDDTVMTPAARIVGSVIDTRTGKPAVGVRVATQVSDNERIVREHGGWSEAITDGQGRYEIGGLRAGDWNLMLLGADKKLTAPTIPTVKLASGGTRQVDFKLKPGQRVHGTLTDVKTGKPIADCEIHCSATSRLGGVVLSERTNKEGQFEFYVPPGQVRVYVSGSRQRTKDSDTSFVVVQGKATKPLSLTAGVTQKPLGVRYFSGVPLERLVSLKARRIPLHSALKKICDEAGVLLQLDRDGLKQHGYTANMAVTVELRSVKLRDGVAAILQPFRELAFTIAQVRDAPPGVRVFISSTNRVQERELQAARELSQRQPKDVVLTAIVKRDKQREAWLRYDRQSFRIIKKGDTVSLGDRQYVAKTIEARWIDWEIKSKIKRMHLGDTFSRLEERP